jgi:glycosyltransferase involved in cell wall biosynthesis
MRPHDELEERRALCSPEMEPILVDYLVGGVRISVGQDSNTPGPRTHILGFTSALKQLGVRHRLFTASELPMMLRFTRIKQTDYSSSSQARLLLADVVRVVAALWTGICLYVTMIRKPAPDVIYERLSVLQSLASFHPKKGKAFRVLEVNGIMSRETARDRKALFSERLAAVVEKRAIRKADLVVSISANLADEIATFASLRRQEILVVPNGVSSALVARPVFREVSSMNIGFCGSVVKWQRLDRLFEVFAKNMKVFDALSGRTPILHIIGDGPELSSLRVAAKELAIEEHVVFHGKQPHSVALDLMSSWDIGCAGHQKSTSSTMYHSPLKLYEYAALGMNLVCTPSEDARSLGESGAFVRQYETDLEFENCLRECVANLQNDIAEIDSSRATILRDHGWENRVQSVLKALPMERD